MGDLRPAPSPPGRDHRKLSLRLCKRILPSESVTTAETAGTGNWVSVRRADDNHLYGPKYPPPCRHYPYSTFSYIRQSMKTLVESQYGRSSQGPIVRSIGNTNVNFGMLVRHILKGFLRIRISSTSGGTAGDRRHLDSPYNPSLSSRQQTLFFNRTPRRSHPHDNTPQHTFPSDKRSKYQSVRK